MINLEERRTVVNDCSDLSIDVETEFVAGSSSSGRTVDIFEETTNAGCDLIGEEDLRDGSRLVVRTLNHVASGEIGVVTIRRKWSREVSRRDTASASERNTEPILQKARKA